MTYTIENITKEIMAACAKANIDFDKECPIKINNRLKTTLGRVRWKHDYTENKDKPISIEFSKLFLETSKENTIKEVILHETAHYIVLIRTGKSHGHDEVFKQVCKELGIEGTKSIKRNAKDEAKVYKYFIRCPECDVIIGKYFRKNKIIKNIQYCQCGRCKNNNLELIQNY